MDNEAGGGVAAPSTYASMTFDFKVKPISSQASRSRKDAVTGAIREQTRKFEFLLSADVAIEIVWHVHEQDRYESDESADVDNIIKPVLDALSGPEGIIINDCQVQFISSHWVSRFEEEDEHLTLTIKYDPEAWFPKKHLVFVQLHQALCMPINTSLPPEGINLMLDIFQQQMNTREKLLGLGHTYEIARGVMSIQRLFHRSRVNEFQVLSLKKLRGKLWGKAWLSDI